MRLRPLPCVIDIGYETESRSFWKIVLHDSLTKEKHESVQPPSVNDTGNSRNAAAYLASLVAILFFVYHPTRSYSIPWNTLQEMK